MKRARSELIWHGSFALNLVKLNCDLTRPVSGPNKIVSFPRETCTKKPRWRFLLPLVGIPGRGQRAIAADDVHSPSHREQRIGLWATAVSENLLFFFFFLCNFYSRDLQQARSGVGSLLQRQTEAKLTGFNMKAGLRIDPVTMCIDPTSSPPNLANTTPLTTRNSFPCVLLENQDDTTCLAQ